MNDRLSTARLVFVLSYLILKLAGSCLTLSLRVVFISTEDRHQVARACLDPPRC